MNFFSELAQNKIFISAASGWVIAQVLKTIIHTCFTKNFVAERLVGGGGMPSSHSSTVCALAVATCYEFGPGGYEFALALILALIVMHDAMGVRRETGIQAKLLNEIIRTFEDMGRSEISTHDKLKELVGHTPLQVLMGALLGVGIALLNYNVL